MNDGRRASAWAHLYRRGEESKKVLAKPCATDYQDPSKRGRSRILILLHNRGGGSGEASGEFVPIL